MHEYILNDAQKSLMPLVRLFKNEYMLVGGTAIALHLGHRKSIDFDLFKRGELDKQKIDAVIETMKLKKEKVLVSRSGEYTFIIEGVKFTFFRYSFDVPATVQWKNMVKMPSLENLSAMKAHVLGRRSSWKDYTDLYFMLKNGMQLKTIIERAESIFKEEFSAKLFRQQLCYFNDLDPTEKIDFVIPNPPTQKEIKAFLTEQAIS